MIRLQGTVWISPRTDGIMPFAGHAPTALSVHHRDGFLVRFADDGVFVFETERDARAVLAVLPKRFEKYGLKLHYPGENQIAAVSSTQVQVIRQRR
jgi:predicted phosphohydrolase